MECIEDIGFGAEFIMNQVVSSNNGLVDGDVEENNSDNDSSKVVVMEIERNGETAVSMLRQIEVESMNCVTVLDVVLDSNKNKSNESNSPISSKETPGATIHISYKPTEIGIRTLLSKLNHNTATTALGGHGQITILDTSSHRPSH